MGWRSFQRALRCGQAHLSLLHKKPHPIQVKELVTYSKIAEPEQILT